MPLNGNESTSPLGHSVGWHFWRGPESGGVLFSPLKRAATGDQCDLLSSKEHRLSSHSPSSKHGSKSPAEVAALGAAVTAAQARVVRRARSRHEGSLNLHTTPEPDPKPLDVYLPHIHFLKLTLETIFYHINSKCNTTTRYNPAPAGWLAKAVRGPAALEVGTTRCAPTAHRLFLASETGERTK